MKKSLIKLTKLAVIAALCSVLPSIVSAEGRMYVPKADPEIKFQVCRFYKVERGEGSTICRYRPQSGGDDVVVTTEDELTFCQREFRCKII